MDERNAFNSLDKCWLLEEVSVISRYVSSCPADVPQYQIPFFFQGDPLGPALFLTPFHPYILMDIQKANPGIQVLAYLDGVFLLGLPSEVFSVMDSLWTAFVTSTSRAIADFKCEIYSPRIVHSQISSLTIWILHGLLIVGTPIEKPQFVENSCCEPARSGF